MNPTISRRSMTRRASGQRSGCKNDLIPGNDSEMIMVETPRYRTAQRPSTGLVIIGSPIGESFFPYAGASMKAQLQNLRFGLAFQPPARDLFRSRARNQGAFIERI